jgi:hypothetical protein
MKKFFLLFVFFVVIATGSIFAQSAKSVIRSKYVGPDGLTFYDKPVIQTNLTFRNSSGAYFEIWLSTGFNNEFVNGDYDDEIDYTLGWQSRISRLYLDVAVTYFDQIRLFYGPYNDVIMGSISLEYPILVNLSHIAPYAKYTPYIVPDNKTEFSGGSLYSIGVKGNACLVKKVKLLPSLQLTYDNGAFGVSPGSFVSVSTLLNYEISKRATWNVIEFVGYLPIGNRPNMVNEFTFGTGFSYNF